jgi:hypothetical protein
MKLWNSLDEHQALQAPTHQSKLQAFVLESLKSMYHAFERDRKQIPKSQIIDIRYEEFVAKPVETLDAIYGHLSLEDRSEVRGLWEAKSAQEQGYQTNKLDINPEQEAMVLEHWANYARCYGYLVP